ncbi:uncharacterized protein [Haliotis asinina]|uniref:uncharacterized protein n=1 Tax=Haliotis asinina TaxID=109174 RepID=UPI003532463C
MKIVGGPACVASLAVYMMFLGSDNMNQVHASEAHSDGCVKVNFTMAENDCKHRNRSLFTLLDLKASTGGRVALNVTNILKEIWIQDDGNGSCQTLVRLPTKGSANKTDDYREFQNTSCKDQHHYVCIQYASKPDMEPQYHPSCYPKTSRDSGDEMGNCHDGTFGYLLVITAACLVITLAIGIVAVYVIIQRKTRVKSSGTWSEAGDAQHKGSNSESDHGCGLQTEGTDYANHASLAAVECHGPVDATESIVVVQCKDPADVDSLEASPSDVTY